MTMFAGHRCTDPREMLTWSRGTGRLSDRKARLLAASCCRRVWPLLCDERSRTAVEVAERYADGQASEQELAAAWAAGWEAARERRDRTYAAVAALGAAARAAWPPETGVFTLYQTSVLVSEIQESAGVGEGDGQCDLLRDIVVPPFGGMPAIDPTRLAWNRGGRSRTGAGRLRRAGATERPTGCRPTRPAGGRPPGRRLRQ